MFIAVVPPTLSLPRKGGGEFGAVFFSLPGDGGGLGRG
jgi:hypothetical protein